MSWGHQNYWLISNHPTEFQNLLIQKGGVKSSKGLPNFPKWSKNIQNTFNAINITFLSCADRTMFDLSSGPSEGPSLYLFWAFYQWYAFLTLKKQMKHLFPFHSGLAPAAGSGLPRHSLCPQNQDYCMNIWPGKSDLRTRDVIIYFHYFFSSPCPRSPKGPCLWVPSQWFIISIIFQKAEPQSRAQPQDIMILCALTQRSPDGLRG